MGDSLTYGYPDGDNPYTHAMLRRLQECAPSRDWVADNHGISGDVTSNMLRRLRECLHTTAAPGSSWNSVVILGGTNDLGSHVPAEDVLANLKAMADAVKAADATPYLVTIPQTAYDEIPGLELLVRSRRAVNAGLVRLCEGDHTHVAAPDAPRLVHLHASIPWVGATPEERERYFSDALHFTSAGNDLLGGLVADAILRHEGRPAGVGEG